MANCVIPAYWWYGGLREEGKEGMCDKEDCKGLEYDVRVADGVAPYPYPPISVLTLGRELHGAPVMYKELG